MKKMFLFVLCIFLPYVSCKKNPEKQLKNNAVQMKDSIKMSKEVIHSEFVNQSTDEETAKQLITFLTRDYLKNDLSILEPKDRKFQFYKIDLNDDGMEEIFVRFFSSYFCGTGGCTLLLLDNDLKIITNFSVTRPPIYAEKTRANGWAILLVKDAGVFKELAFKDGTYPSNPSVLPKAPYDAPSGHAEVLFDDELYKSKTFNF